MYTLQKILLDKIMGVGTVFMFLTLADLIQSAVLSLLNGTKMDKVEIYFILPACAIWLMYYTPRFIKAVRNAKIYGRNVTERFKKRLPEEIEKLKNQTDQKPDYNSFLSFLEMSLNNGVDDDKLNAEIRKEKYVVKSIADVYDKVVNGEFVPASGKLLLYQISGTEEIFLEEKIWY